MSREIRTCRGGHVASARGRRVVVIALCAAVMGGCKDRKPPRSALASESAPRGEVGAPAEPVQTGVRPAGGCDPTGTWQVKVSPKRLFVADTTGESFELALGFVREDSKTVLAAAGRPGGGEIGGLLADVQVSLFSGPDPVCQVRLVATHGVGERARRIELVFSIQEHKLHGFGARWQGPAMWNESFAFGGERSEPTPAEWAKLGEPATPWRPAEPRPADAALAAAVAKISAESLLGPPVTRVSWARRFGAVAEEAVRTPLRGSIVEYVAAVVGQPQDVSLVEVPCSEPLAKRCVAVVGDPCRPEFTDPEDFCEGMFLNVVVDVERGRLDRADNSGYPVRSHADIARWEWMAP